MVVTRITPKHEVHWPSPRDRERSRPTPEIVTVVFPPATRIFTQTLSPTTRQRHTVTVPQIKKQRQRTIYTEILTYPPRPPVHTQEFPMPTTSKVRYPPPQPQWTHKITRTTQRHVVRVPTKIITEREEGLPRTRIVTQQPQTWQQREGLPQTRTARTRVIPGTIITVQQSRPPRTRIVTFTRTETQRSEIVTHTSTVRIIKPITVNTKYVTWRSRPTYSTTTTCPQEDGTCECVNGVCYMRGEYPICICYPGYERAPGIFGCKQRRPGPQSQQGGKPRGEDGDSEDSEEISPPQRPPQGEDGDGEDCEEISPPQRPPQGGGDDDGEDCEENPPPQRPPQQQQDTGEECEEDAIVIDSPEEPEYCDEDTPPNEQPPQQPPQEEEDQGKECEEISQPEEFPEIECTVVNCVVDSPPGQQDSPVKSPKSPPRPPDSPVKSPKSPPRPPDSPHQRPSPEEGQKKSGQPDRKGAYRPEQDQQQRRGPSGLEADQVNRPYNMLLPVFPRLPEPEDQEHKEDDYGDDSEIYADYNRVGMYDDELDDAYDGLDDEDDDDYEEPEPDDVKDAKDGHRVGRRALSFKGDSHQGIVKTPRRKISTCYGLKYKYPVCNEKIAKHWVKTIRACISKHLKKGELNAQSIHNEDLVKRVEKLARKCIQEIGDTPCRNDTFSVFREVMEEVITAFGTYGEHAERVSSSYEIPDSWKRCVANVHIAAMEQCYPGLYSVLSDIVLHEQFQKKFTIKRRDPRSPYCLAENLHHCPLYVRQSLEKMTYMFLGSCIDLTKHKENGCCRRKRDLGNVLCSAEHTEMMIQGVKSCLLERGVNDTKDSPRFTDTVMDCLVQHDQGCNYQSLVLFEEALRFLLGIVKSTTFHVTCKQKLNVKHLEPCAKNLLMATNSLPTKVQLILLERVANCFRTSLEGCPSEYTSWLTRAVEHLTGSGIFPDGDQESLSRIRNARSVIDSVLPGDDGVDICESEIVPVPRGKRESSEDACVSNVNDTGLVYILQGECQPQEISEWFEVVSGCIRLKMQENQDPIGFSEFMKFIEKCFYEEGPLKCRPAKLKDFTTLLKNVFDFIRWNLREGECGVRLAVKKISLCVENLHKDLILDFVKKNYRKSFDSVKCLQTALSFCSKDSVRDIFEVIERAVSNSFTVKGTASGDIYAICEPV